MSIHKKTFYIVTIVALIAAIAVYLFVKKDSVSVDQPKHLDWPVYTNATYDFSIQHPDGFVIDENFSNLTLGPGKTIPGVLFTVPKDMYGSGTNLNEIKISVEFIRNTTTCSPQLFLFEKTDIVPVLIEGIEYGQGVSTDAGAGQIYTETVLARLIGADCVGFRLLVHTGNIGMYDPGSVSEFSSASVMNIFADMVASAVFNKTLQP